MTTSLVLLKLFMSYYWYCFKYTKQIVADVIGDYWKLFAPQWEILQVLMSSPGLYFCATGLL